jgi:hypothetical protein
MSGKQWARWLTAPLAIVAVGLVLSRLQPGAEAGGRTSPPTGGACAGSAPLGIAGAIDQAAVAAGHGTWWRLADSLDAAGTLVGKTLYAGQVAKTTLTLPLGTESMARGPVAGLLVVTNDDGRTAEVRIVSIGAGCSWLVHRDANVVRSAILDPIAGVGYAHLVQRDTRRDLGVFKLTGGDPDVELARVLEPLAPQADLGPIWATELRLDADGTALAVQSCSDQGCLTRVVSLNAFGTPVTIVRGAGQGSIVGFAGERIITWGFCAGMPCELQAWTAGGGKPSTLVDRAVGAGLTNDGRYLVVVTDGTGHAFRLDLATNVTAGIRGVAAGELPLGQNVTATAGLDVADDQVGMASAGGSPHALAPGAAAAP